MNRYMTMAPGAAEGEVMACVLDVSASMGLHDWPPTRLDGAKQAMRDLISEKARRWATDEIAIVAFSGSASVVHPPAPAAAARAALITATESLRPRSSTNIAAGLAAAGRLLGVRPHAGAGLLRKATNWLNGAQPQPAEQGPSVRRILLLSDGDSNEGADPVRIAEQLKATGVIIDVIGIASRESVNETTLKAIASRRADGSPRYCFIGDRGGLIREFRRQAGRLRELDCPMPGR